MGDIKDRLEEWAVRVTFAEADEAAAGFEATGEKLDRKIKVALDKMMVVRTEITDATQPDVSDQPEPDKTDSTQSKRVRPVDQALQVMIVDDEPIVGKRLTPALSKYGIVVEYFQDSTNALARLKEKEFDVVITDFRMQEVDGLQILDQVMATAPNTRVVMITGYGSVEVAREALSKGAFDFISKPFKPKDMRAVINKAALSLGFKGIENK